MECPRCRDGNDFMRSKTTKFGESNYTTLRKCVVCGYKEVK